MRASTKFGLMVVGALAMGASTLAAQTAAPVGLKFSPSLFAGAAVPTGDFADGAKTGYNIGGGLDMSMGMPIGFRADVDYSGFSFKDAVGGGNGNIFSGRLNATVGTSGMGPRFYGIAGGGFYRFSADGSSDTKFGFNVGAGIDLPLGTLASRIEARYHSISSNGATTSYVPVTFGIRF